MNDPLTLIEAVLPIAHRAGEAILAIYHQGFEVQLKNDRSPVTAADLAASQLIRAELGALTSDIPTLCEEAAEVPYHVRQHWRKFWLIDPIDGTKEFVHKNDEFTVNIALIEDGKATLGVIHAPALNQTYWGIVGQGAWRQLGSIATPERLPVSSESEARPYRVLVSRSHLNAATSAYVAELRKTKPDLELVALGSSLKLCRLAEGAADCYPRFSPTMEWDTAAGHAILQASGGDVVTTDGGIPLHYNKPDLRNPWFMAKG